ncbi:hypothetical protein ASG22_02480 [Chryseobacterium sp. Leaf405]|nr:hypothetical protein ASG22_02480 [Chryseobacterium sp. Leaf405]
MKKNKIFYVIAFMLFLLLINPIIVRKFSISKETYYIVLANIEKSNDKNEDSLGKKDKSQDKRDKIINTNNKVLPPPPQASDSKIYAANIDSYIPVLFIVAVIIIVFFVRNKNVSNRK